MSVALAQAAANGLRTALLDNGVRAVSIELQQGVAGSGWYVPTFKRGLGHHIASRPSMGLTPGLATVKNGRGGKSPLGGPLANCYGGYDLVARIITLGWANHPGAGGPWAVPGWGTIPVNNGRPYIFGWEFEGGYEPYTDDMHHFMACCGAGTLDWLGTLPGNPGPAPLECWDEHKGWAGPRKPDRIGYTTASGRARIAAVRGNPTNPAPIPLGDTDMYLVATPDKTVWKVTDYDVTPEPGIYRMGALAKARGIKEIVQITQEELNDNRADAAARRAALLTDIAKAAGGDVDEAALGKAVVDGLLPQLVSALSIRTGATRADIEQVVRGVFADAGTP